MTLRASDGEESRRREEKCRETAARLFFLLRLSLSINREPLRDDFEKKLTGRRREDARVASSEDQTNSICLR